MYIVFLLFIVIICLFIKNTIIKAYKYRIYFKTEQKVLISKTSGCVRKVYSLMLAEKITNTRYKSKTTHISKY
ncbi:MAG: helix-turn-helix domain-containing protein [Neisseriaceae bacterium]|nr:MAG: helix-turn-helix domain-containing protein [Neisseriaceae bacterium]